MIKEYDTKCEPREYGISTSQYKNNTELVQI